MRKSRPDENFPEEVWVFEHFKHCGHKFGYSPGKSKILFEINAKREWIEAYEKFKKEVKNGKENMGR